MRVYALVGGSGTGKSYNAMDLAYMKNIDYIIDDGLLISKNKVLAGNSAKREKTKMAAVKRALFLDEVHRSNIIDKIKEKSIEDILIIGTSEKMVNQISQNLKLGSIFEYVYIEEIATKKDIENAKKQRLKEGKHVIPVPTFQLKKQFSGYLLNPIKIFKNLSKGYNDQLEKTVMRPTFSYLGDYSISDKVLKDIIMNCTKTIVGIHSLHNIFIKNKYNGLIIEIKLDLIYGLPIVNTVSNLQKEIISDIEYITAFNIVDLRIIVKSLIIPE